VHQEHTPCNQKPSSLGLEFSLKIDGVGAACDGIDPGAMKGPSSGI